MSTQRKIGPYIIGRTLGEGGFSKVKLGKHEVTGELVALKLLKSSVMDKSALKQVEGEIQAMAAIKHPNVLQLKDFNYAADYPKKNGKVVKLMLVVLECAKGGELFEFLSATGQFEETIARSYFHQLMEGVGFCHSQNVVHRDLKPENLLFDENFVLKIADFGFSKVVAPSNTMYTQCGTPGYMAPEMFAGQGYDAKKVDVWACGVILFIMVAGFPPFQKPNVSDWWFHKLKNNRHELFWRAHCRTCYFSDQLKDLLNKILCPDPSMRISLDDIRKHAWVMGSVVSAETLFSQLHARKAEVDQQKRRDEMVKLAQARGGAVGGGMGHGAMAVVRSLGVEDDDSALPPSMEFYSHGVGVEVAAPSAGGMGMAGGSMSGLGGLGDGSTDGAEDEEEVAALQETFTSMSRFEVQDSARSTFALVKEWVGSHGSSQVKVDERALKTKATIQTTHSNVRFVAQVCKSAQGKIVVDMVRLDGDGMAFRSLFAQLHQFVSL